MSMQHAELEEASPHWPAARQDRLGLHVLVVEDDAADAYLIAKVLADNPRVSLVVHARDGVDALELIDSGVEPDLAIVDLHMPRKNGLSLLVELSCRDDVKFPTVVLTSSKASSDATRSKLRGASRFETKPDTIAEFNALLFDVIASL
jgi:CheY-like chemotaxis protein